MEINEVYNNIKKWSENIEEIVYLSENLKGKEYIKNYKLKDIQHIDKFVRKCERCGKDFIPNPNFKKYQKYCDIHCRNQATRINRYEIKLDERQRPVDLLRKTIYERKYRARRDNLEIDIAGYNLILKRLSTLVKSRWKMTKEEYEKQLTDLQYDYDTLVRKGKGSI